MFIPYGFVYDHGYILYLTLAMWQVIPVTDGTQLKLPIKTNGISCDRTKITLLLFPLSLLLVPRILDSAIDLSYTIEQ